MAVAATAGWCPCVRGEGTTHKVSRPDMWPENGVGLFEAFFFFFAAEVILSYRKQK